MSYVNGLRHWRWHLDEMYVTQRAATPSLNAPSLIAKPSKNAALPHCPSGNRSPAGRPNHSPICIVETGSHKTKSTVCIV